MEVLQEKEQPLLRRKEYIIKCQFDNSKTPSNQEMLKNSSSLLKAPENLIIVKKIRQEFGLNQADVSVYVYEDQKSLDTIEKIKKKPKIEATPEAKK